MRLKVLGLGCQNGYSGVHKHLWACIAKKHELKLIDTRLSGLDKYWNTLYCFKRLPGLSKYLHPIRSIVNNEANYYRSHNIYYLKTKTACCEKSIKGVKTNYDIILQTTPAGLGPSIIDPSKKPRFIYTDFTMKQSEREYPQWAKFFSEKEKIEWFELEKKTYHNAAMIFTMSDNTRNSVINDYGVDKGNVVATYAGVNLKKLPTIKKDFESKTILFTGIEYERKGLNTLIKAFKEVKKEIKDAKLFIAGSNPKINEDGIVVKGYIDRSELLKLYEYSSIFAMPSICEPFGLVFLEAMAFKTPCIGTKIDAIPEIIEDGRTGLLVSPNDYKQLADKLIFLLEDEYLMRKMGECGRKRVEKYFTWDIVVDRMTEEFKKYYNRSI